MTQNYTEVLINRLAKFAIDCQLITRILPKTSYNLEYSDQLNRSSASPGANYIEAVEAESRKDFIHRLKICKKETKESLYWLRLIEESNKELLNIPSKCNIQISEGYEIIKIFSSSISTAEKNSKISK